MDIMAIAVHPDDETLGAGGALLKAQAAGHRIHWVLLTAALEPDCSAEIIGAQQRQIDAAREAWGFSSFHWFKLPAARLETLPLGDIIGPIEQAVSQVRPHTVYIPHAGDVHSDHRVAAAACHAVTKSFYMRKHGIQRVLAMEVLSETDAAPQLAAHAFLPTVWEDISDHLERKLEIMALFENQVHPDPFPRGLSALKALARVRGATIGVEYAEAFQLIREIT